MSSFKGEYALVYLHVFQYLAHWKAFKNGLMNVEILSEVNCPKSSNYWHSGLECGSLFPPSSVSYLPNSTTPHLFLFVVPTYHFHILVKGTNHKGKSKGLNFYSDKHPEISVTSCRIFHHSNYSYGEKEVSKSHLIMWPREQKIKGNTSISNSTFSDITLVA